MPTRPGTRIWVPTVLTATALVLTFSASAVAQKQGGTFRFYLRDNPPSASPHEETTNAVTLPFMALYNNLVLFDPSKKINSLDGIVGDLATGWSWDASRTKLTFKLREGVKWHDGNPFTAKDVQCTWHMLSGKTRHDDFRRNPRGIWYQNLDEVAINGDYEATFHLKTPQPSLLGLLASGQSPVYPCHVPLKDMRTKPVGTGPFKFVEHKRNEGVKIARNPDYWKPGRPYLDAIEMRIIDSRSTRLLAFAAGEFDMTFDTDVTIPLLKSMAAQAPKAICELRPINVFTHVIVNSQAPPFDKAEVRRAMALALDRNAFNAILAEGQDVISATMLPAPDGLWALPPEELAKLPGYGGDVEGSRAEGRKLMEGLGYGQSRPLKIKVSTRNIADFRDPAVILIDQLKAVHIEGELETIDPSVWLAKILKRDYVVGLNLTGASVDDPDVGLVGNYACKSDLNVTQYCNPDIDKLLLAQSRETDPAKRRQMVWDIERRLIQDVARPTILHRKAATCWHPHVKGLVLQQNSIYNNWRFEDVWLDKSF